MFPSCLPPMQNTALSTRGGRSGGRRGGLSEEVWEARGEVMTRATLLGRTLTGLTFELGRSSVVPLSSIVLLLASAATAAAGCVRLWRYCGASTGITVATLLLVEFGVPHR